MKQIGTSTDFPYASEQISVHAKDGSSRLSYHYIDEGLARHVKSVVRVTYRAFSPSFNRKSTRARFATRAGVEPPQSASKRRTV